MKKRKILVVEDDEQIRKFMCYILKNEEFTVMEAETGEEALILIEEEKADMVLLDLGLPGIDGMEVLEKVRKQSEMPIIIISARDQDCEKAAALDMGADDYLTKPFLPRELILRILAILRRTYRLEEQNRECYRLGSREVDLGAGTVKLLDGTGKVIQLTNKEYQLLKLFLENRGRILTFDCLSESVWGENYYDYENTLMVHIRRLREKIEEKPSNPAYLITVKGLGYRLNL